MQINNFYVYAKKILFQEEEFEKYMRSENAGWTINDTEVQSNGTVELQPTTKSISQSINDVAQNKVGV